MGSLMGTEVALSIGLTQWGLQLILTKGWSHQKARRTGQTTLRSLCATRTLLRLRFLTPSPSGAYFGQSDFPNRGRTASDAGRARG